MESMKDKATLETDPTLKVKNLRRKSGFDPITKMCKGVKAKRCWMLTTNF